MTDHQNHNPETYSDDDAFCPDCEAWQYDQVMSPEALRDLQRIGARSALTRSLGY